MPRATRVRSAVSSSSGCAATTSTRRCVVSLASIESSAESPPVEGGGNAVPGALTASKTPAVRQAAAASRRRSVFFIRSPRECTTGSARGLAVRSPESDAQGTGRLLRVLAWRRIGDMRKLSASALLVAVAFLSLLACRKAARPAGLAGFSGDETVGLFQKGSEVVASPREVAPEQGKGTRGEDAPAALGAARKLIQNAEVSIEVRDFDTAAQKAGEIARSLGGYVADSQAAGEGKRRHGALTVRVPAGSFEKALGGLRHLGKVQSEHLGVQDITKAYTDLESRLMVKRDAAGRIREILRNGTASRGSSRLPLQSLVLPGRVRDRNSVCRSLGASGHCTARSLAAGAPAAPGLTGSRAFDSARTPDPHHPAPCHWSSHFIRAPLRSCGSCRRRRGESRRWNRALHRASRGRCRGSRRAGSGRKAGSGRSGSGKRSCSRPRPWGCRGPGAASCRAGGSPGSTPCRRGTSSRPSRCTRSILRARRAGSRRRCRRRRRRARPCNGGVPRAWTRG